VGNFRHNLDIIAREQMCREQGIDLADIERDYTITNADSDRLGRFLIAVNLLHAALAADEYFLVWTTFDERKPPLSPLLSLLLPEWFQDAPPDTLAEFTALSVSFYQDLYVEMGREQVAWLPELFLEFAESLAELTDQSWAWRQAHNALGVFVALRGGEVPASPLGSDAASEGPLWDAMYALLGETDVDFVAKLSRVLELLGDARRFDVAEACHTRGMNRLRKEEYAKAIADFSQALSVRSDHRAAYYNRGQAYLALEQGELAEDDFSRALELKANAKAYQQRGKARLEQGKLTEAVADGETARRLDASLPGLSQDLSMFRATLKADEKRRAKEAEDAERRLDERAWKTATNENTVDAYKAYLGDESLGHRYAKKARRQILELEAQQERVKREAEEARRRLLAPQDIHGWERSRVQALQQEVAELLRKTTVFRDQLNDGNEGPEMVLIPAGRFRMGSPVEEPQRDNNEGPQHEVTFARPFAIGRYAVTFAEYDAYCAATGCTKPSYNWWGRDQRPVINVSWKDATTYADRLGEQTGQDCRLPTEAEWEYACRAGTTTRFWWGNTITPKQANYDSNYSYNDGPKGESRKQTIPVDQLAPNRWGLYQMHGNVREWTQDYWHDDYTDAPDDSSGWCASGGGNAAQRVVRGGGWSASPKWLRSAERLGMNLDVAAPFLGFRLARSL
jgi:formylglycine-generating enzyme required for sulfatase activity